MDTVTSLGSPSLPAPYVMAPSINLNPIGLLDGFMKNRPLSVRPVTTFERVGGITSHSAPGLRNLIMGYSVTESPGWKSVLSIETIILFLFFKR